MDNAMEKFAAHIISNQCPSALSKSAKYRYFHFQLHCRSVHLVTLCEKDGNDGIKQTPVNWESDLMNDTPSWVNDYMDQ